MSLFGSEPPAHQDSVDRYLATNTDDARAVLRPQPGESHLRVHGQTKYAVIQDDLIGNIVHLFVDPVNRLS